MNDPKLPEVLRQALPRLQANMPRQVRSVFEAVNAAPGADTTKMTDAVNDWLKQADLADGVDLEPIKPRLNEQAIPLFEATPAPRTIVPPGRQASSPTACHSTAATSMYK